MHARLKIDLPSEAETSERMGVPSHDEVAARAYELFDALQRKGKTTDLEGLERDVPTAGNVVYTRQQEPKGLDGNPIHLLPTHVGQWWYLSQLLIVIGFSTVLFFVALMIFGRLEGNFAEEL